MNAPHTQFPTSPKAPASGVVDGSRKFRLHWLVILPLVLLGGLTIFDQILEQHSVWIALAWGTGAVVVAATAAWGLTYGLWKLVGLTRAVGTLVFAGLVLFGVLQVAAVCVIAWRRAEDRGAALILDQVIHRIDLEFGSIDVGESSPDAVKQALDRLGREIESRRNVIDADERDFTYAGGVTLPGLISTQAIDKRIDLARKSLQANETLVRYFDALVEQLDEAGGRPEMKRVGLQRLGDQLRQEYQYTRKMRPAEAKVFKAEIDVLQFLRQHWGEWSYNRKVNDPVFPNAALQKQIDALEDIRNNVVHERDAISAQETVKRSEAEHFQLSR